MTAARDDILERIRRANRAAGDPPVPDVPRGYRRTGGSAPGSPALVDLFEDRLLDYHATVHRTRRADVAMAVGAALTSASVLGGRVIVPAGLPPSWSSEIGSPVPDEGLSPAELDTAVAVVTGCAAACAETGTIVLDGSDGHGRRAVTLVPDVHVCVVLAEQVVDTVPELLGRLDPRRALTFISGPSATSDIELSRVEGVHGPRNLHVVLVTDEPQ